MKECPVCQVSMDDDLIVCPQCMESIARNEPERRKGRVATLAQGLMLFFAIFLFLKASWAGLDEKSYADFVESFGLSQKPPYVHYLGAVFGAVSALLYAAAWIGGFLRRSWRDAVCGAALLVFTAGQIATQYIGLSSEDPIPKAVALVAIWLALPVIQFLALMLGGKGPWKEAGG